MKNAPHPSAPSGERCTDQEDSADQRASLQATFRIQNLRQVDYGSKRAQFDVEFFGGALIAGGELFVTERDKFVAPASIRNRYSGAYERTAQWSDELSAAILDAVLSGLGRA